MKCVLTNAVLQHAMAGCGWYGNDLNAFVVMPNHVHGILVMHDAEKPKPLGRIVGAFKTVSTKNINQARNGTGLPVWQRNYYEHIIRNDEDLNRIRDYILRNPAQWMDDVEYKS